MQANFSDKSLVVFRENFYPEWEARIDNRLVEIKKINLSQIGLEIPKGTHQLVLSYKNFYPKLGFFISGIYLILFLLILKFFKRSA